MRRRGEVGRREMLNIHEKNGDNSWCCVRGGGYPMPVCVHGKIHVPLEQFVHVCVHVKQLFSTYRHPAHNQCVC